MLQSFAATVSAAPGSDDDDVLATRERAIPWLRAQGLMSADAMLTGSEHGALLRLRDALRDALAAHASGSIFPEIAAETGSPLEIAAETGSPPEIAARLTRALADGRRRHRHRRRLGQARHRRALGLPQHRGHHRGGDRGGRRRRGMVGLAAPGRDPKHRPDPAPVTKTGPCRLAPSPEGIDDRPVTHGRPLPMDLTDCQFGGGNPQTLHQLGPPSAVGYSRLTSYSRLTVNERRKCGEEVSHDTDNG